MRRTSSLVFLLVFTLVGLLVPGCSDPAGTPGTVVVGLTAELVPGVDFDRLRVVMRAGEEVLREEVLTTSDGTLELPLELPFEDLEGGTPIELEVEAFRPGDAVTPLVSRAAVTEVVGGETRLLRVRLERACVLGTRDGLCESPQTCIAGSCTSPEVAPESLEPYTPGWLEEEPDVCKPAGAGEPVVLVGEGQADYLPLEELEEVQVEAGPQGGHHIWIAIRMKNLRQSGSITSVSGHVPPLGHDISPFNVIFTFDPSEGGYCKLYGLRFQLDGAIDIQELLGKVVRIRVTVTDPDGVVGVGEREVTLSETAI